MRELEILEDAHIILALGRFAWEGILRALAQLGHRARPRPPFAHGRGMEIGPYVLLGCLHPSQQNTFTGRLTPAMLDAVLAQARARRAESRMP